MTEINRKEVIRRARAGRIDRIESAPPIGADAQGNVVAMTEEEFKRRKEAGEFDPIVIRSDRRI